MKPWPPKLHTIQPRGTDRRAGLHVTPPFQRSWGYWWFEQRRAKDRREPNAREHEASSSCRDEALLCLAFEEAPEAFVLIDPRCTMLAVNRQCERQFGYRRDELLGKSFELLLSERDRAAELKWSETAPHSQGTMRVRLEGRRHDGAAFPLELSLSRIGASTGHWSIMAILRETLAPSGIVCAHAGQP